MSIQRLTKNSHNASIEFRLDSTLADSKVLAYSYLSKKRGLFASFRRSSKGMLFKEAVSTISAKRSSTGCFRTLAFNSSSIRDLVDFLTSDAKDTHLDSVHEFYAIIQDNNAWDSIALVCSPILGYASVDKGSTAHTTRRLSKQRSLHRRRQHLQTLPNNTPSQTTTTRPKTSTQPEISTQQQT